MQLMWFTMKISSRFRRLLIYDVKRTTKIDGMGPFKVLCGLLHTMCGAFKRIDFEGMFQISSTYSVPKLRYIPHSDYNIYLYMLQNHSSSTLFTLCVPKSLIKKYTKFYLPTMFQSLDIHPHSEY